MAKVSLSDISKPSSMATNRPKNAATELNNLGLKKGLEVQKKTAKDLFRETISGEKGGPVAALKNTIGRSLDVFA